MSRPEEGFRGLLDLHSELVLRDDGDPARSPFPLPDAGDWSPRHRQVSYRAINPAALPLDAENGFHDQSDAALLDALQQIIQREGPIHDNLLTRRLLQAVPTSRTGSRIRARIEGLLQQLMEQGGIKRDGDFLATEQQRRAPPYRDWSDLPDAERQLDHVHARELMQCLLNTVVREAPLPVDEAMNRALHGIGFIRFTAQARARMQGPLDRLLISERVAQVGDELLAGPRALLR